MDFPHRINTSGDGYWSDSTKEVSVLKIEVTYITDEKDFGELCVYFDTDSWNTKTDGLIYTDNGFEKVFKLLLLMYGLDNTDVDYSEQGMQGDEYVSLDVGPKFIASWFALNGVQV